MNQHQKFPLNAPGILKKKKYSKPVLTVLGKVSDLTTAGSNHQGGDKFGWNTEGVLWDIFPYGPHRP